MFSKILIANRGEIACRVIRSARRLGVQTVAVYSEADANARHVRLADEAVLLGPPPAKESYLRGDAIIAAAKATGAQAIHPGYGFLSENADFVEACEQAGVVFIGPPSSAIRAMGSKSAAKALMEKAGVPLTPGYHGEDQAPDFLAQQADKITYPVLIKASAGGGGKGMRRVDAAADFAAALTSCKREAAASFGDDHVLVEKYLARARHIEIQIFADKQGNCIYLFERDCSVQRRHQKVLEEAPAPGLTRALRCAMGEAAVAAAKAVGYVGAGTVEFIASADIVQDGIFCFMEMNTRLQVEHPVTEMVTGQDLVEWQLRVACGEPLPLRQDQLELRGHAIEARVYAEDPSREFLPSTGTLLRLAPPAESLHVRVDTGVEEGDAISPHYDPMIAKLIVWDIDRDSALGRMRQALADYQVAGVTTNLAFLARLVACPAFAEADLDTALIPRSADMLFPAESAPPASVALVATVAELLREREAATAQAAGSADPYSPWAMRDGWRLNLAAHRKIVFRAGDERYEVGVVYQGDDWLLSFSGEQTLARAQAISANRIAVELDERRLVTTVIAVDMRRHVFLYGSSYQLLRDDPLHVVAAGAASAGGAVAPMPGKVVALVAQAGQVVEAGAPLLVLEAMKMEHTITAPTRGKLKAFRVAAGDQVSDGDVLVDLEPLVSPDEKNDIKKAAAS